MAGESTPTLQATGISKAFGATQALKDVDFLIYPGERVAVMGENGAGKSTLMKVFAGVHTPDSGVMHLGGDPYRPHLPNAAIAAGVSTVYQEPSGFGHLTVLENIFMGRQRVGRFGVLDRRTMQREAEEILETLELPSAVLGREMRRLALAEQQQVLIARAVMRKARMLILDEPTSILTSAEANRLFDLIDRLAAGGTSICYITHRFDELERTADRFVVLRDGRNAGETRDPDRHALLEMMGSGNATPAPTPAPIAVPSRAPAARSDGAAPDATRAPDAAPVVLDVDGLSSPGAFDDVSLQVREGEIVGLYGLVGAGRTEVALTIFGELAKSTGVVRYRGEPFSPTSSREALAAGVAYLPEDRKSQGIFEHMSVGENLVAANLRRIVRLGVLARRRERKLVQDWLERLSIRTRGAEAGIMSLSGGNQQKVLLARLLASEPNLLILDEPTRGIDVRTKQEIHQDIRGLAEQGMAILVISSELPELLALADRVYVLHEGRLSATLSGTDMTERAVLAAAVGVAS
jgi:ABC-type sugar transport system ATPase subunit